MPTNSESNRFPRPCVSFRTETSRQPERWLLTGASGQLGRHLLAQFLVDLSSPVDFLPIARKGGCLNGHTVHSLDLRDRTALHRLLKEYRPTHIIHLASLSRPGLAQDNPQGFHDLDVTTTKHLAAYTVDVGGWMFYASSDFVLRGDCVGLQDENAAVRTNTIYARGKLEGEQAVLDCGAGCVGRLSMLWGMTADETPWGRLVARLIAGQEIFGITDELRTPLMFETAARIILALAVIPSTRHSGHRGYRGRINIGGDLVRTPFNLICHLRDNVAPSGVVLPITRSEYAPATPRPANAALDISLLNRVLYGYGAQSFEGRV